MSHPVSPPRVSAWLPIAALGLLSLVWGLTWLVAKVALSYAPPLALATSRCIGGALSLVVVTRLSGRRLTLVAPMQTVWVALTQVTGFLGFQTWALVEGGPGKTAVLIFTMPIWMLLLARPVLGERIRGLQWAAALATVTGLTLIIAPWDLHASVLTEALGLAAAVCWAVATVLVKRLRRTHDVDALVLTTWQMLIGTVPLLLVMGFVEERPTQWGWVYAGSLAFLSVGSTALGWWLWSWVLQRVPAWEASLSVLGTPVVAIVGGAVLLGERFKALDIAGIVLIGAGLGLLTLFGWMSSRPRLR